jgi:hypothetical protein
MTVILSEEFVAQRLSSIYSAEVKSWRATHLKKNPEVATVVTGSLITKGSVRYQQGIENLVPVRAGALWKRRTAIQIKIHNADVSAQSKEPKIYAP